VRLDTIGEAPRRVTISTDADERAALTRRFALVSIGQLEAEAEVRREGMTVFAGGRLWAQAVQSCVATGEPLPTTLDVPFSLRFIPEEGAAEPADEVELSEQDCDTLTYAGGAIDLGEAVAETLVLSLNPFPRSPGADDALKAAGVVGEEDAGPFSVLKGLREKLEKK
jgi:uncharacterized metal-binding protein YceD (DUF177 family)